ncbi:MAG: alpha/beta hydrolase [Thiohalospira sp.]
MNHRIRTGLLAALTTLFLVPATQAAERVETTLDDRELVGWWEAGDADREPILMLHGTLAHGQMEIMETFQGLLAQAGIPSLSINLSYGQSGRTGMADCDITHRHTPDSAVDELATWQAWLREQGHTDYHLLAHSRGGADATRAVLADRIEPETLQLVAPATWERDAMYAEYEETHGRPLSEVLEEAEALKASEGADAVMEPVGLLYCQDTAATAESVLAYYADNEGFDAPSNIEQLERPVLVVAGSEDDVVPELAERIDAIEMPAGSEFVTVDGAGHFFRDFFADDTIAAVTRFLDQR